MTQDMMGKRKSADKCSISQKPEETIAKKKKHTKKTKRDGSLGNNWTRMS